MNSHDIKITVTGGPSDNILEIRPITGVNVDRFDMYSAANGHLIGFNVRILDQYKKLWKISKMAVLNIAERPCYDWIDNNYYSIKFTMPDNPVMITIKLENIDESSFNNKINDISYEILSKQQEKKKKIVEDEEKNEESDTINFGELLLNGISDLMTKSSDNPILIEKCQELCNTGFSKKMLSPLLNIISSELIYMIYSSIVLYDDLLRDELNKQLDHIANHINMSKSDIEAIKAVIQIHSKDLTKIKESIDINKFKKDNGIQ